jgi:hypothetical protein
MEHTPIEDSIKALQSMDDTIVIELLKQLLDEQCELSRYSFSAYNLAL